MIWIKRRELPTTSGKGRIGTLYIDDTPICTTLENESKLIPDGTYWVEVNKSPKFKRDLPLLSNNKVSASRGIRIHAGNKVSDSAGCILVGEESINPNKKYTLLNSRIYEYVITNILRTNNYLIIFEEP